MEGRLSADAQSWMQTFVAAGEIFYSPVSAWEIGLLGRPRRDGPRMVFDPGPEAWFDRFRRAPGMRELRLSPEIAMASALLPPEVHSDPADRFLIATARRCQIPLVTGDRRIIDYAASGILDVIACHPEPQGPP